MSTHRNMPHLWLVYENVTQGNEVVKKFTLYMGTELYNTQFVQQDPVIDSDPTYPKNNTVHYKIDVVEAENNNTKVFKKVFDMQNQNSGSSSIQFSIYLVDSDGVTRLGEIGRTVVDYDDADKAGGGGDIRPQNRPQLL